MVHALITAGIYGSAYESDAFCSEAVSSISRPYSNFNCLDDFYPDHADMFRHYFSMYYRNIFLLSIHLFNGEGGFSKAVAKFESQTNREWMNHSLQLSVTVAFRLFSGMCICHTSSLHLLKLYPYVSHLIDAHCVRNSLHRGRLSVTAKYTVVDAAIVACTCQMHTGENTSEIYGRIMRTFVASRGGKIHITPRPRSTSFQGFLAPTVRKSGPRERQLLLCHRQFVFGVRGGRHARRVPRSSREKKQFRSVV